VCACVRACVEMIVKTKACSASYGCRRDRRHHVSDRRGPGKSLQLLRQPVLPHPAATECHATRRRGCLDWANEATCHNRQHTHLHTHTRLTALCPGLPGRAGTTYQKGKANLDFTEARDSGGCSISWAICKSAPHSRQTTTPAPHHSYVFLQVGCPSCSPTNSVKALKATDKLS